MVFTKSIPDLLEPRLNYISVVVKRFRAISACASASVRELLSPCVNRYLIDQANGYRAVFPILSLVPPCEGFCHGTNDTDKREDALTVRVTRMVVCLGSERWKLNK